MKPYSLTTQAQQDLDGIGDYLFAERGLLIALKVVDAVEAGFFKVAADPGIGHYRLDLLDERHRFYNVYSYLIVYRWEDRLLSILAVIHGARDLQTVFAGRELQ